MIKEFLKEHPFFRLEIVYIDGFWENGWQIRLYDDRTRIMLFSHKILATAIENLNVDFETAIMTPIINWYEQQMEEKEMIKLEGRVLLFDVVDRLYEIPKGCKLTIPEKVPLTWHFEHDKPIGFVMPIRDDNGIYATAETFSNEYIGIKDIQDILTDGKIGIGGYYRINKMHEEGELNIIDEAILLEIGLTLAPVREEYYFKIVE